MECLNSVLPLEIIDVEIYKRLDVPSRTVYLYTGYEKLAPNDVHEIYLNFTQQLEVFKYKSLPFIKWFYERGLLTVDRIFDMAAITNDIDILEWAKNENIPFSEWTASYATDTGSYRSVEWLLVQGCPVSKHTLQFAIPYLDILKLLYNYYPELFNDNFLFVQATKLKTPHVLEWLHTKISVQSSWNAIIVSYACINGNLAILEWIYNHSELGYSFNKTLWADIVCSGNLDVVKWFENIIKTEPTPLSLEKAAYCGHIHILEYFIQNFPLTDRTGLSPDPDLDLYDNAIVGNQLEICDWLYTHGFSVQINVSCFRWVVTNQNNLKLLIWIENHLKPEKFKELLNDIDPELIHPWPPGPGARGPRVHENG